MSRDIGSTNEAEVVLPSLREVVLAKLEFDTPLYVHSSVGTITFDGNDYLGVGDFGSITDARESEVLGPNPLTLQLSGINSEVIDEALNAGAYGDKVTIYIGYRQDDGTLIDDPWLAWAGAFEYATIKQGATSAASITLKHDLAVLSEANNRRFTDEDQQQEYSGDTGFEFVADMVSLRLNWAGGPSATGRPEGPRGRPNRRDRFER